MRLFSIFGSLMLLSCLSAAATPGDVVPVARNIEIDAAPSRQLSTWQNAFIYGFYMRIGGFAGYKALVEFYIQVIKPVITFLYFNMTFKLMARYFYKLPHALAYTTLWEMRTFMYREPRGGSDEFFDSLLIGHDQALRWSFDHTPKGKNYIPMAVWKACVVTFVKHIEPAARDEPEVRRMKILLADSSLSFIKVWVDRAHIKIAMSDMTLEEKSDALEELFHKSKVSGTGAVAPPAASAARIDVDISSDESSVANVAAVATAAS